MKIKPLQSGGRSLEVQTPYLDLDIIVNPDLTITINSVEIKEPRTLDSEQLNTIEDRSLICETCDQNQGITIQGKPFPVYTVKCKSCGCGGLSLLNGKCPKGKWNG